MLPEHTEDDYHMQKSTDFRSPDKSTLLKKKVFLYFSVETYVVGAQKNRLIETVLLGTQNTCLN